MISIVLVFLGHPVVQYMQCMLYYSILQIAPAGSRAVLYSILQIVPAGSRAVLYSILQIAPAGSRAVLKQ